jgi:hypothetical protein
MQIVRLYDPTREPHGWLQIIQPHQFAAFATLFDSGAVCDADGVPMSSEDASCVIFGTLPEAEAFCRERVARNAGLRFDILDAAGPGRAPLFTIVNASKAAILEQSPAKVRRNTRMAIVLLLVGPALIWFDWTYYEGVMVMPTIVGINAVLIAVRLFIMNGAHASAERARLERVSQALGRPSTPEPSDGA